MVFVGLFSGPFCFETFFFAPEEPCINGMPFNACTVIFILDLVDYFTRHYISKDPHHLFGSACPVIVTADFSIFVIVSIAALVLLSHFSTGHGPSMLPLCQSS